LEMASRMCKTLIAIFDHLMAKLTNGYI